MCYHYHFSNYKTSPNLYGILSKHTCMKYSFQHSEWKWSEGSSMPLINWGLSYLYPHYGIIEEGGNQCDNYLMQNLSLGILKPNTGQLPDQHCSAFEIFPDHSHVSVFPVNCSVKYWSKILCENRHRTIHTSSIQGIGVYWINSNNTLTQTKYICPEKFNLVFDELCVSLKIFDHNWFDKIDEMPNYQTYIEAASSNSYSDALDSFLGWYVIL